MKEEEKESNIYSDSNSNGGDSLYGESTWHPINEISSQGEDDYPNEDTLDQHNRSYRSSQNYDTDYSNDNDTSENSPSRMSQRQRRLKKLTF